MRSVVIIGDSGHSKVIADIVKASENLLLVAKLDDKYSEVFLEDQVIKGPVSHIHQMLKEDSSLGIVIGIGSNTIRKKIVNNLSINTSNYITLIHPSAELSPSVELGYGTVIMPKAVINASTEIGSHCIINSGCVIEHDCVVADYAHVSPLACLTGGVHIGEGVHVGAGATVIPQIKIDEWTVVGAGSVVISNLAKNLVVVGSPTRIIKKEGF